MSQWKLNEGGESIWLVASMNNLMCFFLSKYAEMFFLCENVAVSEAGGNEFPTPEFFCMVGVTEVARTFLISCSPFSHLPFGVGSSWKSGLWTSISPA